MAILSTFSLIFAEKIVYLFQPSDAAVRIGAPALRFACLGLLAMPLSVPINMLYQSIRKAGTASFLSILRSGLAFIPVLLIGVHFFGILGIQIAQPVGDIITGLISILFIVYFLKKTPNEDL